MIIIQTYAIFLINIIIYSIIRHILSLKCIRFEPISHR